MLIHMATLGVKVLSSVWLAAEAEKTQVRFIATLNGY